MQYSIIKVERIPKGSNFWLHVIKELQHNKFSVQKDFSKKADLNIVLSGAFENPRGYNGKRVMVLQKKDWVPFKLNAWDNMYRDIVKHYYDEIIDVTAMNPASAAKTIIDYIHAEEWKTYKS